MDQEAGMCANNQAVGGGISMEHNDSVMSAIRLNDEVDIIERFHADVVLCPVCEKYSEPPLTWKKTKTKLLKSCIRRLKKNLNNVQHAQAEFIQTEPESKRIKVKLTVLQEVLGEILEKSYTFEYVVHEQMCVNCSQVQVILDPVQSIPVEHVLHEQRCVNCSQVQAIPDPVQSMPVESVVHEQRCANCSHVQAIPDQLVVQLRQNVSHRRTFFHLEQLILKHGAAVGCIRIKQVHQGLDFIFSSKDDALKFVEFLSTVVPVKPGDPSICDNEYVLLVDICPICPGDLICLPREFAAGLVDIGPLVICTKITDCIVLMDTSTMEHCHLDGAEYWTRPFKSLLSSSQLVEYVVLEIDCCSKEVVVGGSKYILGNAFLARLTDFWENSIIFNARTHLGGILNRMESVYGYDLTVAKSKIICLIKDKGFEIPDVVLVKKCYDLELEYKRGNRPWFLKRLDVEVDDKERMENDYKRFVEELEGNPDIWSDYNFYKNKDYDPSVVESLAEMKREQLSLRTWEGLPPFPEKLLLEEPVQVGKFVRQIDDEKKKYRKYEEKKDRKYEKKHWKFLGGSVMKPDNCSDNNFYKNKDYKPSKVESLADIKRERSSLIDWEGLSSVSRQAVA